MEQNTGTPEQSSNIYSFAITLELFSVPTELYRIKQKHWFAISRRALFMAILICHLFSLKTVGQGVHSISSSVPSVNQRPYYLFIRKISKSTSVLSISSSVKSVNQ